MLRLFLFKIFLLQLPAVIKDNMDLLHLKTSNLLIIQVIIGWLLKEGFAYVVYICIYMYIHVYTCLYMYIHVYTCICINEMNTCMYIFLCISFYVMHSIDLFDKCFLVIYLIPFRLIFHMALFVQIHWSVIIIKYNI